MLFSVVVPVYNVEKYLLECLNSIANQAFDDYEVILVDDGSTDSSGKICDEFCATHDKFKVFHKQNEGLLKTRLFGRTKMNGEYMVSIDSDDFIANNSFEILNNYIEKYDKPDVICFNKYIYQDDKTSIPSDALTQEKLYDGNDKEEIYIKTLTTYTFNNMVTKAIKCDLLEKDDTDYSKFCKNQGEDISASLFVIFNANKILLVKDFLYFYRYNVCSITKKKITINEIEQYNLTNLFDKKLDYIQKFNLPNELRYDVLYESIKQLKYTFIKVIMSSNKTDYQKNVLNYNWTMFFDYNKKLDSELKTRLKFIDKLIIFTIKRKNIFLLKITKKIYELFYIK